MGRYFSFDLEIATSFPDEGEPLYECLGISCAATLASDGEPELWCSRFVNAQGMRHDRMTIAECHALVQYLSLMVGKGYIPVGWNILFDWKVLAFECHDDGLFATCIQMAKSSVDPMFTFLCRYGFPIGLEKASSAMGLGLKEGMHGAEAPIFWRASKEEQERVLNYVTGDVKLTAALYETILKCGQVSWITSSGKTRTNPLALTTIEKSLLLPVPNLSWFRGEIPNFWTRECHIAWMNDPSNDSGHM